MRWVNKRVGAMTVVAAMLAACALEQGDGSRFDASEVTWSKAPGRNIIAGAATLGTESGKVRTCASLPVRLAPDSDYTRARIARLYGDDDEAFVDARSARRLRERAQVDKQYERSLKSSVCDAQGRFAFRNLPDGTYYVLAPVVWKNKLGEVANGGFFMQRVTVAGGETRRLTLAMR